MEKFFNPESIVIFGLSSKKNNIPSLILQNTVRWGFKGRVFGVTPGGKSESVQGVTIYNEIHELPVIPDLAVMLIPAKFVPLAMEECGKFGIKRIAVLAGGFNESGESGAELAQEIQDIAEKYSIRFVGPNGLAVADTYSGICLPFCPHEKIVKGGFSLISQSGGLGLVLWTLMSDENVGMAKFVSIGNKLNIDEVDMLEYYGRDPETKVIGLYLESINDGERLIKAAEKIDKPIVALKANTTSAGSRAAMSHTASMSNDDDITNTAFEKAGIIRIDHVHDFVTMAKVFNLPPMMGNRIMAMTPGGGTAVMMADLCEKYGFEFADPGEDFYTKLNGYTNAGGIIKFSNPLDMGDIYDAGVYPKIFHDALNNVNVDGAIFATTRPMIPENDDSVFKSLFYTDIYSDTKGVMLSSGKPLGMVFTAESTVKGKIKKSIDYPLFDRVEELVQGLRIQSDYYQNRVKKKEEIIITGSQDLVDAENWLKQQKGDIGEEVLDLMGILGLDTAESFVASDRDEAVACAKRIGYPVVLKVVSPDVLHKSDAGGVILNIRSNEEAADGFDEIIQNIESCDSSAVVEGIRVSKMADNGNDMFVGGMRDKAFGPVIVFGYGGIYTEVFKDIDRILCPASCKEIERKLEKLKSYEILKGARGKSRADIDALVSIIERVSHLMARCPEIIELDLNPVRVFNDGEGALILDGRAKIESLEINIDKPVVIEEGEYACV